MIRPVDPDEATAHGGRINPSSTTSPLPSKAQPVSRRRRVSWGVPLIILVACIIVAVVSLYHHRSKSGGKESGSTVLSDGYKLADNSVVSERKSNRCR